VVATKSASKGLLNGHIKLLALNQHFRFPINILRPGAFQIENLLNPRLVPGDGIGNQLYWLVETFQPIPKMLGQHGHVKTH